MSQSVGNANYQYSGIQLYHGVNGPVCIFAGRLSPSTFTDPVVPTTASVNTPVTAGVQVSSFVSFSRVTVNSADIGSLFIVGGVGLFTKTELDATNATSGTWTQLAVP